MPRRKRGSALALPTMMAELSVASYEVIARRMLMMATGTCSPAEYKRMVHEKTAAATSTTLRPVKSGGRVAADAMAQPRDGKRQAPSPSLIDIAYKAPRIAQAGIAACRL